MVGVMDGISLCTVMPFTEDLDAVTTINVTLNTHSQTLQRASKNLIKFAKKLNGYVDTIP